MQNADPFEHYQEENPTGGCEAGCVVCFLMTIITIAGLVILWRLGF